MGYLWLYLVGILWISVGIAVAVRHQQFNAQQNSSIELDKGGELVGTITPLAIWFYLVSCISGPGLGYMIQQLSEEEAWLALLEVLVFFGGMTAVPLLVLLMKWRERIIIDKEGFQFGMLPFRSSCRLPWSEITELKVKRRWKSGRPLLVTVSIHAKGKVYKPKIDRPTWLQWGDPILRTIVSRAHLAEIETEHWVRDTGHNPDRVSRQH